MYQAAGNRLAQAETLNLLSYGDYRKALDYYNQALAVRQGFGDRFRELASLTGVIRAYEALKDYPKALKAANTALTIARTLNSPFAEATALALTGRVYLASGDYPQALNASNAALKTWQQLGIRAAAAPTLDNIGKTYNAQANYPSAIASYNEALAVWRSLGAKADEAKQKVCTILLSAKGLEVIIPKLKHKLKLRSLLLKLYAPKSQVQSCGLPILLRCRDTMSFIQTC